MKLGDKSGQFYLLAAIIIIAFIIGFVAISNYSKKRTPVKVNDFGEELKIESEKVLDYIAIQNQDELADFRTTYSDYAAENNIDIYFIMGKGGSIKSYRGTIETNTHTEVPPLIEMTVEDAVYSFDLKPGENFYFILIQEIEGEKHVFTNE